MRSSTCASAGPGSRSSSARTSLPGTPTAQTSPGRSVRSGRAGGASIGRVVRRILANLLCEDDLAHRRASPSRAVLETVARMAALLRVFAQDGDHLWSPAPMESVLDGPRLILESGPLRDLPPAEEVLAWCETPEAAAHRPGPRSSAVSLDAPLHELLWTLPVPSPSVVAAVHHRAFHLQIAERLGCALPGARMVTSLNELDRLPLP